MVGVRQSFNCVVVRDHSLTGQRMAPHTPQESPKVKTMCFRIGSYRLYAPMVPLAPHPCVRWWNTKEITLKLTRLCLHSLKGGLPTGYHHHPGGVDTNGQGAVFHPLNGSGARGPTGRSNAGRRKQEGYPKVFYPRGKQAGLGLCTVVTYLTKISTGLPFLFRSPEPLFLLNQKKKRFWPPPGRRINSPCRAGKKPTVR